MALNLNSLKNLPTASIKDSSEAIVASAPSVAVPDITKYPPQVSVDTQENKIPVTGPKISLFKLKNAWKTEDTATSVPVAELPVQEVVSENIPVQNETKPETITSVSIEEKPVQQESVSILDIAPVEKTVISTPVAITVTEEVIPDTPAIQSVVSDSEAMQKPADTVESKELFPNFQLSSNLDMDDDLLDMDDIIPIKEAWTEIAPVSLSVPKEMTTPPAETPVVMEESKENAPLELSKETIISEEIISEMPSKNTTSESLLSSESICQTPVITPEYVAEVKAELSEGRRAGFRFFVQNKAKIVAGMGVILSISAIAMFSGSFLSIDIEKSGKSNIQETVVTPPSSDVAPSDLGQNPPPAMETEPNISPSYEMGRDYSVTKNTKKNIRNKTPQGTLTGAEIPTP